MRGGASPCWAMAGTPVVPAMGSPACGGQSGRRAATGWSTKTPPDRTKPGRVPSVWRGKGRRGGRCGCRGWRSDIEHRGGRPSIRCLAAQTPPRGPERAGQVRGGAGRVLASHVSHPRASHLSNADRSVSALFQCQRPDLSRAHTTCVPFGALSPVIIYCTFHNR